MPYTAPDILLMIAAIGLVLTNAITAWRNGAKLDTIGQRAAAIEGHVNSKETKYVGDIESRDKEILLLKQIIADKDATAALLAQASATRSRAQTAPPP